MQTLLYMQKAGGRSVIQILATKSMSSLLPSLAWDTMQLHQPSSPASRPSASSSPCKNGSFKPVTAHFTKHVIPSICFHRIIFLSLRIWASAEEEILSLQTKIMLSFASGPSQPAATGWCFHLWDGLIYSFRTTQVTSYHLSQVTEP